MRTVFFVALASLAACEGDAVVHSSLLTGEDPPAASATPMPPSDAGARPGDAGVDADAQASAPPPSAPGVCDPSAMVGAGTKLGVGDGENKRLGAITADELGIAWQTPADGVVHYADRAAASDPFGEEQTLDATGLATGERVALAQDGLALYAIAADGRSVLAFTRSSRGDAFVGPGSALVDTLNAEGASLGAGERFGDLAIAGSGTALLLRRFGANVASLRLSQRVVPSDPWGATSEIGAQPELATSGGFARRPTGLSADARALFYFDQSSGTEKVAFFDEDATKASHFVDESTRGGLQPNLDCSAVYYDESGEIYVAPRK